MTKKLTNKEKRIRSMMRRHKRLTQTCDWTVVRDAHMKAHGVSLSTATKDWDDAFWRIHLERMEALCNSEHKLTLVKTPKAGQEGEAS
jgi:hypothetical protein